MPETARARTLPTEVRLLNFTGSVGVPPDLVVRPQHADTTAELALQPRDCPS